MSIPLPFPKKMSAFEKDMNAEIQLQAAYATIAQLRDQTDSLNRTVWSLEERLDVFRKADFAGCGELLRKALKYAIGEWPAMKRVLECGDVELSNNLSEQMMRRIKMNLKNAGNIGSERSARHNTFM